MQNPVASLAVMGFHSAHTHSHTHTHTHFERHSIRGRHGGVEKRGGWKTSRMTPLPKRGFGPPPRTVRFPPPPSGVSVLCFSCTEIHDRADQKFFWGGSNIFRESAFSGSGQVRPRQGTEICNFGAPSPLEALHWIFCFFSSIYVQFSKTSPLKSGESSEQ